MPDVPKLLHGPYHPPPLYLGEEAHCLLRGCSVVTSWSDAPISWPRCQPVGQRGGCGLLLAGDLVRAVRSESALAVEYWWGVSDGVVWRWRKVLGVGRMDSDGSRRIILEAAAKGGAVNQQREYSEAERAARRERNRRLNLSRNLTRRGGPLWSAEQLALLGTLPDNDVAKRIGRTVEAVRIRRTRLGIASAADGRRKRFPPGNVR